MKKIQLLFHHHGYFIVVILVLFLATVLRFYDYTNRWGLATDQAHDALVARYALEQHIFPLVGPFSSAGPFVMGPEWYYFIMFGTFLYPSSYLTPWIVLTILYVFTVYLMILIGNELGSKKLGIILGLITAVSTVQISQSFNLTNQAPLSILAALALWLILKYIKTKNYWYFSLASLSIALGVNTHLQGVLLIPLLVITLIVQKPTVKGLFIGLVLFCIPFIPLLIFDFGHNHYELKNMLQYYLHDQYKISLDQFGRNWKSYLGIFWPNAFANVIGGFRIFSYLIFFLAFLFSVIAIKRKAISLFGIIFSITLGIAVIFLRYTHTPLFDSYLMFANPFLFIIVGWVIYKIITFNSVIGYCFLMLILFGSLTKDIQQMQHSMNFSAYQADIWQHILYEKYPHQNFTLYDYHYINSAKSLSLSLFLAADNRSHENSHKVGLIVYGAKIKSLWNTFPHILPGMGYQLLDLQSSTSAQLQKTGWADISPKGIYIAAEDWYK